MTASPHDRLTPAHSMTESATTRRAAFGAVAAPPTALAAAVAAFCGPAGVAEAREHADAGPVTEIVVTASGFEQDVRRAQHPFRLWVVTSCQPRSFGTWPKRSGTWKA
jgi:hypothetical protein